MSPGRLNDYARGGLLLCATALLVGCPVPLPSGYSALSRENIGEDLTVELTAGVTTREEVLLLLGEPDGAGPGDAWLSYGSIYGEGGVIFILCAGGSCAGTGAEKVEYRRLVVTFDEQGLMTNAEFVDRECWEGMVGLGSSGVSSPQCMQVSMPGDTLPVSAGAISEGAPIVFESPIPDDLQEFAAGSAELITPGWFSGFSAAIAAYAHSQQTRDMHDSGQWENLARTVIKDRYGDDLHWYYLGRAAEGLGLCDAAGVYYGTSRERSSRFVSHCPSINCAGITLPVALEDRLAAIETMRSAGQCRAVELK